MSYIHISNLYKDLRILEFKEVYAMEKIHGTSAHITWKKIHHAGKPGIVFFSGGESYNNFVNLFDEELLTQKMDCGALEITIYGEAYGGKQQGMKATYGDKLRFIAFEVEIDGKFLAVPQAEDFVKEVGLEFVHYVKVPTTMEALDAEMNADSVQAVRNGMGPGHKREGIVLRPPFEVTLNNGERLLAKHKRPDFRETTTPRVVGVAPEVLSDAQRVADEWVTALRMGHVLQKLPEATEMKHTKMVVDAMLEDVLREGAGEIIDSPQVRKAIQRATTEMWKKRVQTIKIP